MFKRSLATSVGCLVVLLFWPVEAQEQSPFQLRVTGSCQQGSYIRVIKVDGSVLCGSDADSGGTVTSIGTGSGLTGGPITTTGTISIATGGVTSAHIANGTIGSVDVNSGEIQLRVTSDCGTGSAIRAINADGTAVCQPSNGGGGGVTAVTASPPLVVTGTSTRNIELPNVIIEVRNTAIGTNALGSNTTGVDNTASGVNALLNNTLGFSNTASGADALGSNTTGFDNTASGASALFSNTLGRNNTASGAGALASNTTGGNNTASGFIALVSNTTGVDNTASGTGALLSNTTGFGNTAIGSGADVSAGNLFNATAIGSGAIVNSSNKIRLGDTTVTVIEGQVPFTFSSDQTRKENFQPVDGEVVLSKLRGLSLTSWNYIGHDPQQFRHYGPMGQEFFAAFGHDGIGIIGSPTTLTSSDLAGILMSAVQAVERRTMELRQETERLKATVEAFKAENTGLKARLEWAERAISGDATK